MPDTGNALPADISPSDPTDAIDGVGNAYRTRLAQDDYTDVQDLQDATVAELANILPSDVAQSIKEKVGDGRDSVTSAAEARQLAQQIPGAIGKVVKVNGRQVPKVLEKHSEQHTDGATVEIHIG